MVVWLYGYMDIWLWHGMAFCDNMAVYGYMAIWMTMAWFGCILLYGYIATWLNCYGTAWLYMATWLCTAIRLDCHMAIWLYGYGMVHSYMIISYGNSHTKSCMVDHGAYDPIHCHCQWGGAYQLHQEITHNFAVFGGGWCIAFCCNVQHGTHYPPEIQKIV